MTTETAPPVAPATRRPRPPRRGPAPPPRGRPAPRRRWARCGRGRQVPQRYAPAHRAHPPSPSTRVQTAPSSPAASRAESAAGVRAGRGEIGHRGERGEPAQRHRDRLPCPVRASNSPACNSVMPARPASSATAYCRPPPELLTR
ncbi:hypothetical protein NKG94_13950 [Micromonospora sp. M12]